MVRPLCGLKKKVDTKIPANVWGQERRKCQESRAKKYEKEVCHLEERGCVRDRRGRRRNAGSAGVASERRDAPASAEKPMEKTTRSFSSRRHLKKLKVQNYFMDRFVFLQDSSSARAFEARALELELFRLEQRQRIVDRARAAPVAHTN